MKCVSYEEVYSKSWFQTATKDERKVGHFFTNDSLTSKAYCKWGKQVEDREVQYPIKGYLVNPSSACFPFSLPNWHEILSNMKEGEGLTVSIHAKRCHVRMQQHLIELCELFKKGVDIPSLIPPIRYAQRKVIDLLSSSERAILDGMEQKASSDLYRVCITFTCTPSLYHRLGNFFGEWKLKKGKEPSSFSYLHSNIMSENELSHWHVAPQIKEPIKQLRLPFTPIQTPIHATLPQQYSILPLTPITAYEENDDYHIQIIKAFESLYNKGTLSFDSMQTGPTLKQYIFQLKNLKFTMMSSLTEDLRVALGLPYLSIEGGTKPNTVCISIQRKNRSIVTLGDAFSRTKEDLKTYQVPIFLGVDMLGNPVFDDFGRISHLLVAGSTGSGKSVFLTTLLTFFLLTKKPEELLLYLIDPKQVEFSPFEDAPLVERVITKSDEAIKLLNSLVQEMEKRYELFKKEKVRNISHYRKKGHIIKNIVVIIDEYADLFLFDKSVENYVCLLAQKSRAVGIFLCICTQRPSVDVVSGLVKANLPSRVVFRLTSMHDYKTVLDGKPPFVLMGKGDSVAQLEGKENFMRIQSCLVAPTESEVDEIIEQLTTSKSNSTKEKYSLPTSNLPPSKKEIVWNFIIQTNDTRLRSILKEIGGDMGELVQIMRELVSEGKLAAPSGKERRYKII
ncbi:FtsK/SpoIIIE domain-containing protein [Gottfriedia acidiceleris]|uniref:FtsK/SpoIIIE domain-containing protein n=1 Tax=Gottfriedia acidiceleris TaxID=371036 RepID=UPI002FFE9BC8